MNVGFICASMESETNNKETCDLYFEYGYNPKVEIQYDIYIKSDFTRQSINSEDLSICIKHILNQATYKRWIIFNFTTKEQINKQKELDNLVNSLYKSLFSKDVMNVMREYLPSKHETLDQIEFRVNKDIIIDNNNILEQIPESTYIKLIPHRTGKDKINITVKDTKCEIPLLEKDHKGISFEELKICIEEQTDLNNLLKYSGKEYKSSNKYLLKQYFDIEDKYDTYSAYVNNKTRRKTINAKIFIECIQSIRDNLRPEIHLNIKKDQKTSDESLIDKSLINNLHQTLSEIINEGSNDINTQQITFVIYQDISLDIKSIADDNKLLKKTIISSKENVNINIPINGENIQINCLNNKVTYQTLKAYTETEIDKLPEYTDKDVFDQYFYIKDNSRYKEIHIKQNAHRAEINSVVLMKCLNYLDDNKQYHFYFDTKEKNTQHDTLIDSLYKALSDINFKTFNKEIEFMVDINKLNINYNNIVKTNKIIINNIGPNKTLKILNDSKEIQLTIPTKQRITFTELKISIEMQNETFSSSEYKDQDLFDIFFTSQGAQTRIKHDTIVPINKDIFEKCIEYIINNTKKEYIVILETSSTNKDYLSNDLHEWFQELDFSKIKLNKNITFNVKKNLFFNKSANIPNKTQININTEGEAKVYIYLDNKYYHIDKSKNKNLVSFSDLSYYLNPKIIDTQRKELSNKDIIDNPYFDKILFNQYFEKPLFNHIHIKHDLNTTISEEILTKCILHILKTTPGKMITFNFEYDKDNGPKTTQEQQKKIINNFHTAFPEINFNTISEQISKNQDSRIIYFTINQSITINPMSIPNTPSINIERSETKPEDIIIKLNDFELPLKTNLGFDKILEQYNKTIKPPAITKIEAPKQSTKETLVISNMDGGIFTTTGSKTTSQKIENTIISVIDTLEESNKLIINISNITNEVFNNINFNNIFTTNDHIDKSKYIEFKFAKSMNLTLNEKYLFNGQHLIINTNNNGITVNDKAINGTQDLKDMIDELFNKKPKTEAQDDEHTSLIEEISATELKNNTFPIINFHEIENLERLSVKLTGFDTSDITEHLEKTAIKFVLNDNERKDAYIIDINHLLQYCQNQRIIETGSQTIPQNTIIDIISLAQSTHRMPLEIDLDKCITISSDKLYSNHRFNVRFINHKKSMPNEKVIIKIVDGNGEQICVYTIGEIKESIDLNRLLNSNNIHDIKELIINKIKTKIITVNTETETDSFEQLSQEIKDTLNSDKFTNIIVRSNNDEKLCELLEKMNFNEIYKNPEFDPEFNEIYEDYELKPITFEVSNNITLDKDKLFKNLPLVIKNNDTKECILITCGNKSDHIEPNSLSRPIDLRDLNLFSELESCESEHGSNHEHSEHGSSHELPEPGHKSNHELSEHGSNHGESDPPLPPTLSISSNGNQHCINIEGKTKESDLTDTINNLLNSMKKGDKLYIKATDEHKQAFLELLTKLEFEFIAENANNTIIFEVSDNVTLEANIDKVEPNQKQNISIRNTSAKPINVTYGSNIIPIAAGSIVDIKDMADVTIDAKSSPDLAKAIKDFLNNNASNNRKCIIRNCDQTKILSIDFNEIYKTNDFSNNVKLLIEPNGDSREINIFEDDILPKQHLWVKFNNNDIRNSIKINLYNQKELVKTITAKDINDKLNKNINQEFVDIAPMIREIFAEHNKPSDNKWTWKHWAGGALAIVIISTVGYFAIPYFRQEDEYSYSETQQEIIIPQAIQQEIIKQNEDTDTESIDNSNLIY